MATSKELETERWRAMALALQRNEDEVAGLKAATQANTEETRLLRTVLERSPVRWALATYSEADWKGRAVLSVPVVVLLVLLYALIAQQNPAVVLANLLETTHLCYGGYPHATAAPDTVEAIEADPSPIEPSPDPSPEPAPE